MTWKIYSKLTKTYGTAKYRTKEDAEAIRQEFQKFFTIQKSNIKLTVEEVK